MLKLLLNPEYHFFMIQSKLSYLIKKEFYFKLTLLVVKTSSLHSNDESK